MIPLTPQRTPHGGETLSAAQMQISPEAAIDIPQLPGHLPQQGLPQAENRGRVGSPQGSGKTSRHSRSRGPESRSRPVGEESLAVRRRVFDSGVGSRPVPTRPLPLSDQPAQPTGVMSVGRAMWPAGLNAAVPLPSWMTGAMSVENNKASQYAYDVVRKAQEDRRPSGPVQLVQQNVQVHVQAPQAPQASPESSSALVGAQMHVQMVAMQLKSTK